MVSAEHFVTRIHSQKRHLHFTEKMNLTPTPLPKVADFRGSDARMIEMGCKQTLFAAIKLHGRGREEIAKLKKRENLKTMSRMPVLDKERRSKEESRAVLRAATRALEEKYGDDNPGMTVAALKRLEMQVAGILSTIESISKVDQEEDEVSPMPLQASAPVSRSEVVGVPFLPPTLTSARAPDPTCQLLPFPGFDLLSDHRSTEMFAGGETEATPDLFVDLFDGQARKRSLSSLADFAAVVEATVARW